MKKRLFVILIAFCSIVMMVHSQSSDVNANLGNASSLKAKVETILKKFNAKEVNGFDMAVAVKEAETKYAVVALQQEYFENLIRKYISANKKVVEQPSSIPSQINASRSLISNPTTNNSYCPNTGFENGNFSGWTGDTWSLKGTDWTTQPVWIPGISTLGNNTPAQAYYGLFGITTWRHTIMNVTPSQNNPPGNCIGWDSIAINPVTHKSDIPFVSPWSFGYTCRLGNANTGSETERLVYTFNVGQQNSIFTYAFALVMQNPNTHSQMEQPFFSVRASDQNGNQIFSGCGTCGVYGNQAFSDPTFIAASVSDPANNGQWLDPSNPNYHPYDCYYRKWSKASIDLSAYVGQTINIEFQTADCSLGGHFGYAYIDASCQPFQIALSNCGSNGIAYCVAPEGYASYQWCGPNNSTPISGATNDTLSLTNPVNGDVYTVGITPVCGCSSSIQVTVNSTTIGIQSINGISSCVNGNSGSASVIVTGTSNACVYNWTDTSGNSIGMSDVINNLSPGLYNVQVSTPGCGSVDTSVNVNISPPNFSILTQSFCGNNFSLNSPAGSNYLWYDNNLNPVANSTGVNPLVVPNHGVTNYTVVYQSPQGCLDSTKIYAKLQVNLSADTITFCNNTAVLSVPTGATNIIWYNANWPYAVLGNGDSIAITNPIVNNFDQYYVSYIDPITFCQDSVRFFLRENYDYATVSNISGSCPSPATTGGVTVDLQTNHSSPFNYYITGPNGYSQGYSNSLAMSISLSGLLAGSYSVNVAVGSCSSSSVFIIPDLSQQFYIKADTNQICATDSVQLKLSYLGLDSSCQLVNIPGSSTGDIQIGNGTAQNTSSTNPTPYGNWYSNEKYQILYHASDLIAAGFSQGAISSIAFNVLSVPSNMNTTFLNYTIKISCTSQNDLDSANIIYGIPFIGGVNAIAWGPQNYTITSGWNAHTFSHPYVWDGVSNIIIEICYDWVAPTTYTYNAIVEQSATSYGSFIIAYSDQSPSCALLTSSRSYKQRPNTKFGTCLISSTPPSTYIYHWSPATGLSDTSAANVVVTPPTTTVYTVTATSTNGGCNVTDSVKIIVTSVEANVTSVPCGTSAPAVMLNADGVAPFRYEIDNSPWQSSNAFTTLNFGTHAACVTDSTGCIACTNFVISDSCDLVWPGDANDDLIADNLDMLAIGVGNGVHGISRSTQTIAWNGYPSLNWSQTLAGTSNYKHIDCNGDSIISLDDTLAVIQNFNLTRPASKPLQTSQSNQSTLPPLKMVAVPDTILAGNSGKLQVLLGDNLQLASNVYGLAFTIGFDTAIVDPSSFWITTAGSWMGTSGNNLMAFALKDGINGEVKGAITRYNHFNISGNGLIATLGYKTKTTYNGTQEHLFSFSNVLVIDSVENPILFSTYNDSIIALDPSAGINENERNGKIIIHPNPAQDFFTIENISSNNTTIKLYDYSGRIVLTQKVSSSTSNKCIVNTSNLPNGIFMVEVSDEKNGKKGFGRVVVNK